MGMNVRNDAMYIFWKDGGLGDKICRILQYAFHKYTVKQVMDKTTNFLMEAFSDAGLGAFDRHKAMQTVRAARLKLYTPGGKRIKEQSKLSPENTNAKDLFYKNHILYKALGLHQDATDRQIHSALKNQEALMKAVVLQHKKEMEPISQLHERANQVFSNDFIRKAYDMQGDSYFTNRKPKTPYKPIVIIQPPQPYSPRTPAAPRMRLAAI
jgi:hypothetical protein